MIKTFFTLLILCLSFNLKAACTSPAGIAGSMDYNTGTNKMVFCNGTSWIAMDGSSIVPAEISFEAKLCSSVVNSGSAMIWETVLHNNGSDYSNVTGKFTAPVDGVYIFGFNTLMNNLGSGEYRYAFYKNGSIYNGIIRQKVTAVWETIQGSITVELSSGDTMHIQYETGTGATYNDCNYNRFWGRLTH